MQRWLSRSKETIPERSYHTKKKTEIREKRREETRYRKYKIEQTSLYARSPVKED